MNRKIIPVMLCFFAMGFVDMVGTATNYVKADFALSDTMANFLPSMVFLWFFFLNSFKHLRCSHCQQNRIVNQCKCCEGNKQEYEQFIC